VILDTPRAVARNLLLAALLAAGCKGGPPPARTRPAPSVTVAPVEIRDVPVEITAPVDLRPLAQAGVSAMTIGDLDAVLVDRGVRLARLDLLAALGQLQ
jgi:multidrug efflux pump subunit AcrA (membrane-fusion protein)